MALVLILALKYIIPIFILIAVIVCHFVWHWNYEKCKMFLTQLAMICLIPGVVVPCLIVPTVNETIQRDIKKDNFIGKLREAYTNVQLVQSEVDAILNMNVDDPAALLKGGAIMGNALDFNTLIRHMDLSDLNELYSLINDPLFMEEAQKYQLWDKVSPLATRLILFKVADMQYIKSPETPPETKRLLLQYNLSLMKSVTALLNSYLLLKTGDISEEEFHQKVETINENIKASPLSSKKGEEIFSTLKKLKF
ncbi:hypothetical protein MTBBW1_2050021 [Desulfamplus magnetovallimortis]|uniref:Uncharacterized protein n=2 Tax=Desulfamplus magnetovallimortis TaxID=1246637 RepID=A0A1W1HCC0_9BACT|nr:hypothetical protein MTBBW1_2050021 [Desulfamplus magnetovallimortis]